jgi:hypothetical protein
MVTGGSWSDHKDEHSYNRQPQHPGPVNYFRSTRLYSAKGNRVLATGGFRTAAWPLQDILSSYSYSSKILLISDFRSSGMLCSVD